MRIEQNYSLLEYNTFHLPVKTRWFMEYVNEEELTRILRDEYFQECLSLSIGSGSNLLFLNDYNGIILHSAIKGIAIIRETPKEVFLRVGAAEKWDDVVAYIVSQGWSGVENLSGIPGETGAAAVQNIGAYGMELKDVVDSVEAYNQLSFEKQLFSNEDCLFSYRHSTFKDEQKDPHIITAVTIRLQKHPTCSIHYKGLEEELKGKDLTPATIRQAVLKIRGEKLPDPARLGNAGSFFMNPVIPEADFTKLRQQYPGIPSYPMGEGRVKIPAGWLIEQCGLKGKRHGEVGVYEKQALVLVNYGNATGDEIAMLAEGIRMAVQDRFGIILTPEVKYIA